MPNDSKVKTYTFTASVQLNYVWTVVATYRAQKASLPQAIAAFNIWFNKLMNPDVHYHIDGEADGENVYQHSHIPELGNPQPETREEAELRMRKLLDPKAYQ